MTSAEHYASVHYLVDDVDAAIDSYTTHLGFTLLFHSAPPLADVARGPLRLLLSGPPDREPGRLRRTTQLPVRLPCPLMDFHSHEWIFIGH